MSKEATPPEVPTSSVSRARRDRLFDVLSDLSLERFETPLKLRLGVSSVDELGRMDPDDMNLVGMGKYDVSRLQQWQRALPPRRAPARQADREVRRGDAGTAPPSKRVSRRLPYTIDEQLPLWDEQHDEVP